MDNNIDNLKKFLEKIKTINFFDRLFNWKKINDLLFDAGTDLQKLISNNESIKDQNSCLSIENQGLKKDIDIEKKASIESANEIDNLNKKIEDNESTINKLNSDIAAVNTTVGNQKDKIEDIERIGLSLTQKNEQLVSNNRTLSENAAANQQIINRKHELDIELEGVKHDFAKLQKDFDDLKDQNTKLLSEEESRKRTYENNVQNLNLIREQIQEQRSKEMEGLNNVEIEKIRKLKETWSNHQDNVKNVVKKICSQHTIEYVEKVPFKGEPDNTLKICEEFVIFDAKSPGSDDLKNFSTYLKIQAESAKKYVKQDSVKKEIFLVVPSNTIELLPQFVYRLADYNVFIISIDALEPIILSLQKIEEYEFAEKMSPEDRDNICRILGKFAHLTKRRIQIDTFFIKQFMELAYKAEGDLPKDILEKTIEFERAEKLNPPTERRAKQISLKELDKDTSKLKNEINSKGIIMQEEIISAELNKMQLYADENEKS